MRLAVYVYDFPHVKSEEGIIRLCMEGFTPDIIIGAPHVELTMPTSDIATTLAEPKYHPQELAKKFAIPYVIKHHNHAIKEVKGFDLGIILGARILSKKVIKQFDIGIINLHPGLLPNNRGLHNIQYAILRDETQGATCHLIDDRVDVGLEIFSQACDLELDDSIKDIGEKIRALSLDMLIDCLKNRRYDYTVPYNEEGCYNAPWRQELDMVVRNEFPQYLKRHAY